MIWAFVPESTYSSCEIQSTAPSPTAKTLFLFGPTAKGLSLEELDVVFEVPTASFINYQYTKVLPHWFKKTILRQKRGDVAPLHVMAGKA
jgi:hypothetical protein